MSNTSGHAWPDTLLSNFMFSTLIMTDVPAAARDYMKTMAEEAAAEASRSVHSQ